MRTKKLLLFLLVMAIGWSFTRAITVSPYTETFAGVDYTEPDCAPDGWGHIVLGKQVYELLENVEGVGTCLYIDYQSADFSTYNMFVTPAVTGEVTLQVMYVEAQFGEPWIKFFTCTKNADGTFSQGSAITDVENLDQVNQEGFTTVRMSNVPAGTYIGIAGSYVVIANFTATSAEVEKVDKRQLKVTGMSYTGPEEVDMNTDNTYTLPVTVTLRNTGNVALTASDEDFSVSLITTSGEVVDTKHLDMTLQPATETDALQLEFTVNGNEFSGQQSFYVQENVTKTHSTDYFSIVINAYEAVVEMYEQLSNGRYAVLPSGSTLDFGQTKDIVTREFYIDNTGAAPFIFSEVTVPDGFVTLTQAGDSVPAHSTGIVVFAMDNSTPGKHEGDFVMRGNGVNEYRLHLTGTIIDTDRWFVDFEEGMPGNMIAGAIWRVESYNGSPAAVAQTWQGSQYTGEGRYLISPKLEIKAGESLSFQMAKSTYYMPELNVYFSTDRQNWTLVKAYTRDDFDRTTINSNGACRYTDMTIDTFEPGIGYVMFEGFAMALDNISGFTVVPVDHDLMIIDQTLPTEGEVNTTLNAQVTVKNYGPDEAADSYTAQLLVDGQVVASAEPVLMAAGSMTTFNFDFTPHQAGTFPIVVKMTIGDYELSSTEGTLTINDEVVSSELAVGDATTTNTITGGAPVDPSAMYQVSEIIYPASKINLAKGAKITKITFKGRNTGNTGFAQVQAWIENTSDATVSNNSIHPTDDMTQIMDKNYMFAPAGSAGMTPTHGDMLVIELAEPFEYTGENLRLRFHSVRNTSCTVRYQYDDDAGVAVQQTGWKDEFNYFQDCQMPVMYLSYEKEATTVSGVVTDAATGTAVVGADVIVRSGEVEYTGTSDNDGAYQVLVKKDYLDGFEIMVNATGYKPFTQAIDLTEGALVLNIMLERESGGMRGDLNGDGLMDVTDVSLLIDVVLGKEATLADDAQPDLNGDGMVDVTDVSILIDIVLGKE